MTTSFEARFGKPPGAGATAHARVNLLGEHTDYNDGFVLPTPLPQATRVDIGPGGPPGTVEAYAAAFDETRKRRIDEPKEGNWLDYVVGCLRVLEEAGHDIPGLRIAIAGDVPMGAGIASSAALEVAVLRACRALLGLPIDDVSLARLGQRAENAYVGMPCGIMDQMVAALGTPGRALLLDTRDLSRRLVELPAGYRLAIVHCGVPHRLTEGSYAERRGECEAACRALGVPSLRELDIDALDRVAALPEPLSRRARHVVTENRRVLDGVAALERGDILEFGRLMDASHASQRDDYKVSIPEIDALQESAKRNGAIGARLTGGGFGGSIVALVENAAHDVWLDRVRTDRPDARPIG